MNNEKSFICKTGTKILIVSVLIFNALYLYSFLHEYLETKFFPVQVNTEIVEVEKLQDGMSSVTIRYDKVRNCDWVESRWYVGRYKQASAFVPMEVKAEDETRGIGEYLMKDILLPLDEQTIRNNSFLITYHECNPFFETKSLHIFNKPERQYHK